MKHRIDRLAETHRLTREDCLALLRNRDEDTTAYLKKKAVAVRKQYFGNAVYVRGLIEFSNYCKNDCYYCGIRRSNANAVRYRLTKEQILECCELGYDLGFRTFVLQGGEDGFFTDDKLVDVIHEIREGYPDCAITLSLGERGRNSYQRFFDAGANRYLLRHETAVPEHYASLHPENLTLAKRKECLYALKEIGFQVGTGFMVGSPGQTLEHLAEDLMFLQEFQPQMVGLGPFIPHQDTKYAKEPSGTVELTTFLLAMIRLLLPNVLLPSTTALGTIDPLGRERGIEAGANVVMPNLSPVSVRKNYALYDNKICTGDEAAECRMCLQRRMESIGYELVVQRGDFIPIT